MRVRVARTLFSAVLPVLVPASISGQRLAGDVPIAPTPYHEAGGTHLLYELHLTNVGGEEVTLLQVDAIAADGRLLKSLSGEALRDDLARPGAWQRAGVGSDYERYMAWLAEYDPRLIEPGMPAVVWMEIVLERDDDVSEVIRHHLTVEFESLDGSTERRVVEASPASPRAPARVLGPPLSGDGWWAFNRSNDASHRRGFDASPQRFIRTISQRFAIDYVKEDEFGRRFSGDPQTPANYFSFGEDVLAVADGVVVSIRNDAPDDGIGRRTSLGGAPATLGNYVDLEIAEGVYALYMHLRSGSVRVRAGDSVTRGQVIGQVGTSGASTSPHLHFQLNETPWKEGRESVSFFGEGVPFELSSFDVIGRDASPYCSCSGAECLPVAIEHREEEMLSGGLVVRFPGGSEQTPQDSDNLDATCAIRSAEILAERYEISAAIETIARARSLDADMVVPGSVWSTLCWRGSLAGEARTVLSACENAIAEESEYGHHLLALGMARALSGDVSGAIGDFERYLDWQEEHQWSAQAAFRSIRLRVTSIEDFGARVSGWVDALRAGANPFTAEVLESLRGN